MVEVSILRWPADEALRLGLVALGVPRILLVDDGAPPPEPLDQLEDWLRWPPDPDDLLVRTRHLRRWTTAEPRTPPSLDEHGILRFGDAWVAMSEGQIPLARLLLENLDRVVALTTVTELYEQSGGSGHPKSVRTLVSRIGHRFARVGLEVASVRQRGIMLRIPGPTTDPSVRSATVAPSR